MPNNDIKIDIKIQCQCHDGLSLDNMFSCVQVEYSKISISNGIQYFNKQWKTSFPISGQMNVANPPYLMHCYYVFIRKQILLLLLLLVVCRYLLIMAVMKKSCIASVN